MNKPLRVLIVEDSDKDVALVVRALKAAGYQVDYVVAVTADEMKAALAEQDFDIVISDHDLPQFDAPRALAVLQQSGQDIPFIIFSGVIGEEMAVALMKAGAHDYVMKNNLARLAPAVQRELREAETRRARRRAEEALDANRSQMSNAMEMAHLGHWEYDVATDLFTFNDHFYKIFRTSVEQVGGYTMHSAEYSLRFVHPGDSDMVREETQKAIETTDPHFNRQVDHRILYADGTTGHITVRFFIVKDSHGRTVKTYGVNQDITDRKQVEEALRESEKQYRELVTNANSVILRMDSEGRITFFNQFAQRLFGYTAEEILGRSAMETIVPETDSTGRGLHSMILDIVRRPDSYAQNENENMRRDGSRVWISWTNTPIFNPEGNVCEMLCIGNDITERKRAEEALKNSEYLLNKIFDVLPIGLWFADGNGRLIRGNPAGVKIWGAEPTVALEEYGVFKARRLPSGKEITADEWALAHTIREGVTIVDELLEIDTFDGQKKIILNYTAPVLDDRGAIQGAIVVNHDISEREKLQAQLTQAQKMESVGRLAGGVAHDFNNMLAVILGHAELAMEILDPSQSLYRGLQEIRKAAERSADLTRQLLAFARKQSIAPEVLDLNKTVEGMLKMLRRLIGEDIDLAWLPGMNLWPVKMDPSQIDQILANLCVNARDSIKGVGKITIQTKDTTLDEAFCAANTGFIPGEYVMLAVSDDGCGMDQETQSHLFEPFFTTKSVGKGTGLGLATVYGIVKQNNGFINFYSEPGHGTRFTIYLPRYAGKAGLNQATVSAKPAECGSETVLLVEDEPAILQMTALMLERLGYKVLSTDRPGKAIHLAEVHPGRIDLLMTDVVMPEMNGRDLVGKILTFSPNLRCLFMSGYTTDVIARHGVLDENVHFIQKPFSIKDLATKVRATLDGE